MSHAEGGVDELVEHFLECRDWCGARIASR